MGGECGNWDEKATRNMECIGQGYRGLCEQRSAKKENPTTPRLISLDGGKSNQDVVGIQLERQRKPHSELALDKLPPSLLLDVSLLCDENCWNGRVEHTQIHSPSSEVIEPKRRGPAQEESLSEEQMQALEDSTNHSRPSQRASKMTKIHASFPIHRVANPCLLKIAL